MTTRMVHPEHGATHAYDTGEIERLKQWGWSVEGASVQEAPVPEPVQVAEVAPKKKPGRKPKAV